MKIALDAMGGDLAPKATVEGAVLAARDFGIEVVMVGDGEILSRELADHDAANLPIRIEHAPEVVLMDDSPLESVLSKPRSSIHVGLDLVKRGDASAFRQRGEFWRRDDGVDDDPWQPEPTSIGRRSRRWCRPVKGSAC